MTKAPEVKKKAFPGKRAAIPASALAIRPHAFPGVKHALARLAGTPIRNQGTRKGK